MGRKKEKVVYKFAFTPEEKLKAINLLKKSNIDFVAHRYHCSVRSLYRWRSLYDGTLESLDNKFSRKNMLHPNRHTEEEITNIKNLIRRNPDIGLNELYGKLKINYAYTRHPVSLYRFLRKRGFYAQAKNKAKYIPQPYDTPIHIGQKWQVDVKHVPSDCFAVKPEYGVKYYQYTAIDEATRERFIYPYQDLCAQSTIDFIKRAIVFFGYQPDQIQTDNGPEFTYTIETKDWTKRKQGKSINSKKREDFENKEHLFDVYCKSVGILHTTIKPRTPRHNGKVERSHRNDNERFYSKLKFYSFDDLLEQMKRYLLKSNNIPNCKLTSRDGTRKWLTPNEKRKELLLLDWGVIE